MRVLQKIDVRKLATLAIIVSVVEAVLVFSSILPSVLSYSAGNLVFAVIRLALVAYAGMIVAREGLRRAAINGGFVSLATVLAICVISLVGKFLYLKPLLGISVFSYFGLAAVVALLIVENVLLGAFVAACAAWASITFCPSSIPASHRAVERGKKAVVKRSRR